MLQIKQFTHSKAENIVSAQFGQSKGTRETNRVIFKGFEDKKHYVAVLCDREPGFFESFFYKPLKVLDETGKETIIYVNKSSFQKRFNTSFEDSQGIHRLALSLACNGQDKFINTQTNEIVSSARLISQNIAYAQQIQQLQKEQFEKSKNLEPQHALQNAETLLPSLQQLTQDPTIQAKDVQQMLLKAEKERCMKGPAYAFLKQPGFTRPMLVTPKTTYILLTGKNDPIIGEGGFKTTYYAMDATSGKTVAVAIPKIETRIKPGSQKEMAHEAQMMRQLDGQRGAVQLIDYAQIQDQTYFVMEYCNKGNLADALEQDSLNEQQKVQVAKDIAEILSIMHSKGIVYRDVKPENILLYEDETGLLRAKLCDFGLAAFTRESKTLQEIAGTPEFFSPELAQSALKIHELALNRLQECSKFSTSRKKRFAALRFDAQNQETLQAAREQLEKSSQKTSDIWSLGQVFYLLFHPNGKELLQETSSKSQTEIEEYLEFLTRSSGTTQQHMDDLFQEPDLPKDLKPILARMLTVDPNKRATAKEVVDGLSQITF